MSRAWIIPTLIGLALFIPLRIAADAFGWSEEAIGWPTLAIAALATSLHTVYAIRAWDEDEDR
jgi:hypothetical protein